MSSKRDPGSLLRPGLISGAVGTALLLGLLLSYAILIRYAVIDMDHAGAVIMGIAFISGLVSKIVIKDRSREGVLPKSVSAVLTAALLLLLLYAWIPSGVLKADRFIMLLIIFGIGNAAGGMARINKKRLHKSRR